MLCRNRLYHGVLPVAAIVAAVCILGSGEAHAVFKNPAALEPGNWIVFAQVTGSAQGPIEGSSTRAGREDTMEVFAFNHEVRIPHDPETGLPSGVRVHNAMSIVKTYDKATPKLYQALTTGESLDVTFKWYRVTETRSEEHYFTTTLSEAHIVEIVTQMPNAQNPPLNPASTESYRHMEEVTFTYRKIKWTWEIDGVDFEDDWAGEPGSDPSSPLISRSKLKGRSK